MDPTSFWNKKYIYCIVLYLILIPVQLKKRLQQLKFVSYLLITGVISMVTVFALKTFGVFDGGDKRPPLPPYTNGTILDSMSIILSSYGFILNFFPVYSQIHKPTNRKGIQAISRALVFCLSVFLVFAVLGLKTYGDSI